jgi:hypothetical protein
MAELTTRRARCLCGTCAMEAVGEPLLVTLSSSLDDQRLASAPMRWTAWYGEAQVKTTGTYLPYRHVHDDVAETYWRCATCGTQMWFRAHNTMPGTLAVNAAAFEDPKSLVPNRASEGRLRPTWIRLDEAIEDGAGL